jgi:hypothetical protein
MSNQYWDNYDKKFSKILSLAELCAKGQRETEDRHKPKKTSLFDRDLTDIRLYRKDGKFITPYHSDLLRHRREAKGGCPVIFISCKAIIQNEKNKEYVRKVNSNQTATVKPLQLNLMPFQAAFDEFLEDYLNNAFVNQQKPFDLDQGNTEVVKDLIAYFTRQEDSRLSVRKGICLYGDIGTGKSTLMKQLSKFTKDKNLETQFDFIYMDDVYMDCDSTGLESLNSYRFRACMFDDIGMRAENNVNNYGTKINAYRELVRRQYNRFTRTIPSLSHYTTNIEYQNKDFTSGLVKVFGARELDRFREMCNFVGLFGSSRRVY